MSVAAPLHNNGAMAPASSSNLGPAVNGAVAASSNNKAAAAPSEVGWLFVTQYYTSLNNDPEKLHCYYSKRSTFLHGTEQDESAPVCFGQQQIHERIASLGFQDAKVFVSNLDSQASANGGIIIQVLGEMNNNGTQWRKFTQTFFLAEQPNGFFVLNDIFRYLKDEEEIEEEAEEIDDALDTELQEATEKGVDVVHQIQITPGVQIGNKSVQAATSAGALPDASGASSAAPVVPNTVQNAVDEGKLNAQEPTPAEPSDVGVSTKVSSVDTQEAPVATKGAAQASEAAAQSGDPSARTPALNGNSGAANAAAASAPAAAAAPAGPKTWANLAASNATKWGSTVSAEARGVSSQREISTAAQSGAAAPRTGAGVANGATSSGGAAARSGAQNDGHVFIKNVVTEQMPPEGLQAALEAKYGPMRECHIVAAKACAFGEFATAEAARKAIQHSRDGGVKVGTNGWTVTVEEKRKPGDRPTTSARGGRGGAAGGGLGAGRGGRGGRGGAPRGGRGGSAAAAAGAA